MRLRQLLVILLVIAAGSMIAIAATSELKSVTAVSHGNGATVTVAATGAFGHNEYRASDDLFIVDLTGGVSAGKLKDSERKLQVPGLQSYRVSSYKGTTGEVTRIELRVEPTADVTISPAAAGLQVNIVSKTAVVPAQKSSVATAAPAAVQKPAASVPKASAASAIVSPAGVVKVHSVSVLRGKSGIELEVVGSGPMAPKVLKLTAPDRIVLDIPNAVPAQRIPLINVNSGDVKSVRTSRFQNDPPVTRVVVDMLSPRDYDVSSQGRKIVLSLRSATAAAQVAKSVEAPKVSSQQAPVIQQATAAASAPVPTSSAPVGVPAQRAAAPVEPAVIAPAALVANKESKGGAGTDSEAKPMVMAEPKYQVKPAEPVLAPVAEKRTIATPTVQTAALQQQPVMQAQATAAPASQGKPAANIDNPPDPQAQPQYTGEPISVNLKDVDLKDFFRLIHEISGLNVVLDPGVNGTLTLVLDDVPWDQALDIVLKNNSLDKQVQGNVLRVATIENLRKEAQAKRLQLEAESLAVAKTSVTRFLSYARAKDVMPTVKKMLSARGDIVSDDRMNALVIQDIPSVIPEVDRLISQLDRKTQEVDIEARVVAATRSFKRDIGALVGAGWGNASTAVGGLPKLGDTSLTGISSAPKYFVSGSGSIPIIGNFLPTSPTSGLSFMNETNSYRIDLMLAAAEKRGLLKILSRPHVVTQNNVQALVKQGMRIPITTQAQLNGPSTVQYVDAVLRLTVTPQITRENTIFLNVDIENTQADFSNQLQGNPVFMTEQATTQVLVTDGGTVMIGGVIQTQNSVSTEQVPFLGDVPVLGNLFKHRIVDNSTQELIFIITPKIVQT